MRVALLQPKPSDRYATQNLAYKSGIQAPETGLAVLSSFLRSRNPDVEVRVLNPLTEEGELVGNAASFELVGMSDWFSNHARCISYAEKIKAVNPAAKIALGGPNAGPLGEKIVQGVPSVDYVVSKEGEESLCGLAAHGTTESQIEKVPNLFFRDRSGNVRFTFRKNVDLRQLPTWDYHSFEGIKERLFEYLALQDSEDPWLSPPLAVFSYRGCAKAVLSGPCSYCTSFDTASRALPSAQFWNQIVLLEREYGAKNFYISDDIFTVSPRYINLLAQARPSGLHSRFRAYSYLPFLTILSDDEVRRMAISLRKIGVYNLFFGAESADSETMRLANKPVLDLEGAVRVMNILFEEGTVKSTVALLLGLPGECERSLAYNFETFGQLFRRTGDAFERLYISLAMPLAGSALFSMLLSDSSVQDDYGKATSRDLAIDHDLDYDSLIRLQVSHFTSFSPILLNEWLEKFQGLATAFIPPHRVGGFKLDRIRL